MSAYQDDLVKCCNEIRKYAEPKNFPTRMNDTLMFMIQTLGMTVEKLAEAAKVEVSVVRGLIQKLELKSSSSYIEIQMGSLVFFAKEDLSESFPALFIDNRDLIKENNQLFLDFFENAVDIEKMKESRLRLQEIFRDDWNRIKGMPFTFQDSEFLRSILKISAVIRIF